MKNENRTVIYPANSSAISSITIYPSARVLGVEYASSAKAYSYSINDISVVYDLMEVQVFNQSFGKLINKATRDGRLVRA